MSKERFSTSRTHDLAAALFGVFALVMLVSSPWQVDTTGPDPFYKGPLIFPLIVFSMMVAGALPAMWRLVRPRAGASWTLDKGGYPKKNAVILGLLILYLAGLVTLGLEVSTWLFLTIAMKLVGQDSWVKITVFPAAITLVLYLIFKLFLDIWFPEPLIMTLISE